MKQWYASVNYGLEAVVGCVLKAQGARNIKILDGALVFSCAKAPDIRCVNNLFVVLSSFSSKSVVEAAKNVSRLTFYSPRLNGKTFRVVVMDCGKLRAIPRDVMDGIERNITRQTKLVPNRANPDTEIWLNRRNDGTVYFMARVKKHPPFEQTLKPGELRPDVADAMLQTAGTGGVLVDMFGGWGAIAEAAAGSGQYQKIYTGDADVSRVRYQKTRLRGKSDCDVQKWDALSLPLEDMSADFVVTDPPWGEYDTADIPRLYDGFIREAARILRPRGSLVFLTSALAETRRVLEIYGFSYSRTALKINGKNAFLFAARRRL